MRNKTILRSSRMRRDMAWPMLVAATLPVVAPLPSYGQAMPSGGVVGAGKVSISTPNASNMVVRQDSQRAVVNWNSFSIGKGNTVTFSQPNAGATLNVVKGSLSSEIAGNLKANGSVFLVNQNGIAITPTGLVDTRAGFVASTLGMSEDDFMAGRNVFKGKGGSVVNQGHIVTGPGGNVALLGASVDNQGVISAPLGKVALGAGEAATLDLSGDGYLQVMLPSDAVTAEGQALVSNSGVIEAAGGTVMLKAETVRAALREAVHMPGTIRAQSVSGRNGAIVLEGGAAGAVRVSGTLDASSAVGAPGNGGRIDIGGQQVTLAGAKLDASGDARGGLVRVGGAFQGGKAQEPASEDAQRFARRFEGGAGIAAPSNAATTSIDAASSINVSARGAAGEGGTAIVWSDKATVMRGAIDATGAASAGAVEVSSASTVQSVALNRIALGKGGKLLLDPQDIQIDDFQPADPAGDIGYGDNPGGATHLYSGDLTALLGGGTSISLKASQDIGWNTFSSVVTRPGLAPAGTLSLSAGRSVSLNGIFGTADADWNITANDRAANGVVDAERGAGAATIELGGASFINSNGKLTLHLSDGVGNTNTEAMGITLGAFSGNGLSASIAPGASWGGGMAPYITLTKDVNVAEDITLAGNLSVSASSVTLSGRNVNWTTEASSTLRGEGRFRFVASGVTTRLGLLAGGTPARLALGDGINAGIGRVYGEADPTAGALGRPLLHVTSGDAMDALDGILAAGSLATSGPGVTGNAGSHSISLGGTASLAFNDGLSGSYFIDMTPASIPLTIARRQVTPTVGSYQGVYGTATSVVALNNVVNDDVLAPVASLDGGAQQALSAVGTGYGFSAVTPAASHTYTVTGLTGAAAANYELAPGSWAGSLAQARRPLTFSTYHPDFVYGGGSNGSDFIWLLSGLVGNDQVAAVPGFIRNGGGIAPAGRLDAGSYTYAVVGLDGNDAANYTVAGSGNTFRTVTVAPRVLSYTVDNVNTVYGTPAAVSGPVTLNNVLPGDEVIVGPIGIEVGGARVTASTATTPAGAYGQTVASLAGASASNYTLSGAAPGGIFDIARKKVNAGGNWVSQQYGSDFPSMPLSGLINGDEVRVIQQVGVSKVTGLPSKNGKPSVGTYELWAVGLSGPGAGNYELWGSPPTFVEVTQRELTYTGPTVNWTYGDGGTLPAYTFHGLLPGETFSATPMIGPRNVIGPVDPYTAAGTYALGMYSSPTVGLNYRLADSGHTPGVLNIAKRPLTWNVGNGSAVYGAGVPNAATLNNTAAGDPVWARVQALDANGAPIALPGVGSYSAGVTGLEGEAAANYVLAPNGNSTGLLTISPKQLNLIVNNAMSVYGTPALPSLAWDGLVGGDQLGLQNPTMSISRNGSPVALGERTPAGSYALQASAQLPDNPNYTLGAGSGTATLTVKPKPLNYSGPTNSYEYGSSITGTDFRIALKGVLDGDQVTMPVLMSGEWTNPGARRTVGQYVFPVQAWYGLTGKDAANYAVAASGNSDGLITITPKQLTFRTYFNGNESRNYGDVSGPVAVFSDFAPAFEGDRISFTPGALAGASYSSGGYLNAGTYRAMPGALTGPDAYNYALAASGNTIAELTVVPRKVDSSFTVRTAWGGLDMGKSLVYGSTGGAYLSANRSQALPGDRMTFDFKFQLPGGASASLPEGIAPGTYFVGGALGGSDARNYFIPDSSQGGLFGMIDVVPRPVSVSYPALSRTTYGSTPNTQGTLSGLYGDPKFVQVTGELLDDKGLPHAVGSRTPAGSYTFLPTGLSGSGAQHQYLTQANASWIDSQSGKVISVTPSGTGAFQIDKRTLNVSYAGVSDMVYGRNPDRASVTGWIDGDEVYWEQLATTQSSPTPGEVGRTRLVQLFGEGTGGFLLDAGTYAYSLKLSDDAARNYQLSRSDLGTVRIAQRPVSGIAVNASAEYGDLYQRDNVRQLETGVSGVLSGDRLIGKQSYFDGSGKQIDYDAATNAGSYQARVTSLQGVGQTNVNNYVLDDGASKAATLVIRPRPIDIKVPELANAVYGTSPVFGNAGGILFGDDVSFMLSGAGLASQALTQGSLSDRNLYLDQRVNVGEYRFDIQLQGAKAGNYVVTGRTGGKFTVTPKVLNWTVSAGTGQYGFYKDCDGYTCRQMEQGVDIGKAVFPGALAGDQLDGAVAVLDLQGKPITIDARTPVGNYFEVVTGLTGASANNYTLATSGNLPGTLTIKPLWLRYTTGSSINVLDGYGRIGEHGTIKLDTIGGVPMPNGETVDAITAIFVPDPKGYFMVPLNTVLPPGRYYYEAAGLVGEHAGNYRLMPVSHGRFGVPDGVNTVGTYDVYANTSFGLNLVGAQTVPVRPPAAVIIDRDQTDLEKKWGEQNAPTPDPGRLVEGDGIVVDTNLDPNRAGASVGAGAGADLGSAGGISADAQASGVVSALASFGVTGVTVATSAEGHVDITVSSGPVDLTAGAQGAAEANLRLGRTGVTIGADATVGVYANAGVSGNLGGGVAGNVDITTGTFAYASTNYRYGLVNGVLTMTQGGMAGVGSSIGASGGLQYGLGSMGGGATLYTPGIIGGNISIGAGYSDGVFNLSMDFGAAIGIGGVNFKFNLGVDVGAVGSMFQPTVSMNQRQPGADQHGLSLKDDPAARYAYLSQNNEWNWNNQGSSENGMFMHSYGELLKATETMVQHQQEWQGKMMDLLKTDPAKAVEFSRNKPNFWQEQQAVGIQAARMGVKLKVEDGELKYATWNK